MNLSPLKDDIIDDRKVSIAQDVRDFMNGSTGWFWKKHMDDELQIRTSGDKKASLAEIGRLLKSNDLIHHHADHGKYRKRHAEMEKIPWREADCRDIPVKWPFHIEEYVKFFPRNIAIIASHPDGGKSGFVFDFIKKNIAARKDIEEYFDKPFQIQVFDSEKGAAELKERISRIDDVDFDDWEENVSFWEKSAHFEDVIHPDAINIIDYLEVVENFAEVGKEIKAIHDNLASGIALIALQKNWGSSLGRGGVGSIEKPRLYMTIDRGKLKIEKAKNWRTVEYNPNGMVAEFKLVGGSNFHITRQLGPEYQVDGKWE